MSKRAWSLVAGIVMIVAGAGLYFGFADVETPIIGLRQTGAVVAVLGVLELGAAAWSTRSKEAGR